MVELGQTIELIKSWLFSVDLEDDIVSFGLLFDDAGEVFDAPLLGVENLGFVVFKDLLEFGDLTLSSGLIESGVKDVHDFVLFHD